MGMHVINAIILFVWPVQAALLPSLIIQESILLQLLKGARLTKMQESSSWMNHTAQV